VWTEAKQHWASLIGHSFHASVCLFKIHKCVPVTVAVSGAISLVVLVPRIRTELLQNQTFYEMGNDQNLIMLFESLNFSDHENDARSDCKLIPRTKQRVVISNLEYFKQNLDSDLWYESPLRISLSSVPMVCKKESSKASNPSWSWDSCDSHRSIG
jgi:hypothetical protein